MDDEDSKSEIVHDNQSQASDCSLIKATKRLSRKNDTQKEPPAKQIKIDQSRKRQSILDPGYDNFQGLYYVKKILSNIFPHLSYHLLNRYNQQLQDRQGEKSAETFYTSFEFNEATDATVSALEEEAKVCPQTMETMVKEITNEELDKRISSAKNSNGGRKILLSPPKINGTSPSAPTPLTSNKRPNDLISTMNNNKKRRIQESEKRELRSRVKETQDELRKESVPSRK